MENILKEQDMLDKHYDEVAMMATHVKQLITVCDSSESGSRKIVSRRLAPFERSLSIVNGTVDSLSWRAPHDFLFHQYEEQLGDLKTELGDICSTPLSQDVEKYDELYLSHMWLVKEQFDCSLRIKKLLFPLSHSLNSNSPSVDGKEVRE